MRLRLVCMGKFLRLWTILALVAAMVALGGCKAMFNAKPIPGVPQPDERLKQIGELGKNASNVPPEKQAEYAQTLSTIIHEETDPTMRRAAVVAISNFKVPITEETLRFAGKDPERDVREAACKGWKTYGGEQAVPELIQILANESDVDIRHQAIDLLGDFQDERAIVALEVPLMDNDPALQYYTMKSLRKITGEPEKTREEWIAYCQARHPDTAVAQREEQPVEQEPQSPFLDLGPAKKF